MKNDFNQKNVENSAFSGENTTKTAPKKKEGFWEIVKTLLILAAIVVPFRLYVAQPFIVNGASMDNTFHQGDYLIVDELSYRFREPARGEVVIFHNPLENSQYFIKRIIGLPGETVATDGAKTTITTKSGEKIKLDEPYLGSSGGRYVRVTLKDGEYFVMGDNRSVSFDSRSWGALKKDLIKGRAFVRLFPPQVIDYLPGDYSQMEK